MLYTFLRRLSFLLKKRHKYSAVSFCPLLLLAVLSNKHAQKKDMGTQAPQQKDAGQFQRLEGALERVAEGGTHPLCKRCPMGSEGQGAHASNSGFIRTDDLASRFSVR